MSSEHLSWALRQCDLTHAEFRVLVLLADCANVETHVAWRSIKSIVTLSGMSRSTAKDAIRKLYSGGWLVPGDPRYVAHVDPSSRPNVWLVNRHRGTASDLRGAQLPFQLDPSADGGRLSAPVRSSAQGKGGRSSAGGPLIGQKGGRSSAPNQELEPTTTTHLPAQANDRAREVTDLGGRVPGAASPGRALEHIAAARAAIRKETTA